MSHRRRSIRSQRQDSAPDLLYEALLRLCEQKYLDIAPNGPYFHCLECRGEGDELMDVRHGEGCLAGRIRDFLRGASDKSG